MTICGTRDARNPGDILRRGGKTSRRIMERIRMRVSSRLLIAVLAGSVLLLPLVSGCSGDAEKMTPKETSEFKGGPMPESARKIMQERMEAAAQKSAGAPGAGAAPGGPGVPPPGPAGAPAAPR